MLDAKRGRQPIMPAKAGPVFRIMLPAPVRVGADAAPQALPLGVELVLGAPASPLAARLRPGRLSPLGPAGGRRQWAGGVREAAVALVEPKGEGLGALRWAASPSHENCVKFLLPRARPLCSVGRLLEGVFNAGHVNVATLLIGRDPRILDGVDLSKCHAAALDRAHGGLASYLSAIIDQRRFWKFHRIARP